MSLDNYNRVPLLENYMAFPPASSELVNAQRRPAIVIRNFQEFSKAWPKMEASLNFLLRWRGIRMDSDFEWLSNYLSIFQAYIELGTDISNWVNLDICLPNFEKSSKEYSMFNIYKSKNLTKTYIKLISLQRDPNKLKYIETEKLSKTYIIPEN